MKFSDKIFQTFLIFSLITMALFAGGCNQSPYPRAEGIEDFKFIAQQMLKKLEKGEIIRTNGFYIECAVDKKREKGVRISEIVCDKENTRSITIRITDPTSRPPSQKIEAIQLSALSGDIITTSIGKTNTISNGITIDFDRSGQSVTLVRLVETTP